MPNKDGTGPQGKGSKTGRQMGNCKEAEPKRGLGKGLGSCGCDNRRGQRRCNNQSED
jgi:hypothetical protein